MCIDRENIEGLIEREHVIGKVRCRGTKRERYSEIEIARDGYRQSESEVEIASDRYRDSERSMYQDMEVKIERGRTSKR